MMLLFMLSVVFMASATDIEEGAETDTFYNIRIDYVFTDETPAHDAYIATFLENDPVDLVVTNPTIDGFVPMTLAEGGESAAVTTFSIPSLTEDVTVKVYYVAGLTPYRVMYYKQNIYDDLYTRDNTVPERYTNRYGLTGSNPNELTTESIFDGFTNLFHEPDAIAADGTTVFRVYYDRNYYTIRFDLGDKGYGVDPIYAKYESVYHIEEPKRMGYTFRGWLRTDADPTAGPYRTGEDAWRFVDENGDEYVDGSGNPLFDENGIPVDSGSGAASYYLNFSTAYVPSHDVYYKAIWSSDVTSYSIVYWIQNPNGRDLTSTEINASSSLAEARALIAANYTVAAAKDITGVTSGTLINLDTVIRNEAGTNMLLRDFFSYNLNPQGTKTVNGEVVPRTNSSGKPLDKNNTLIDFPTMSDAKRDELNGKAKYYEYNPDISSLQFGGRFEADQEKTHLEVAGDGTTRINVYFNRKDFTLKFYYARVRLSDNTISLTNSTKGFSKNPNPEDDPMRAIAMLDSATTKAGAWADDITDTMPTLNTKYTDPESPDYIPGLHTETTEYEGYRYYYYQMTAKYNGPLEGKWLVDSITTVPKKNKAGQYCVPGSWAVENETNFYYSHTAVGNFTVKGFYEKLGNELMFKNRSTNFQTLQYLISWTNTASSGWNSGLNHILHFTYENYIELLPREIELMRADADSDGSPDGVPALIAAGLYEGVYERYNDVYTMIDPAQTFVYHEGADYYGISAENRIETVDSGNQYDSTDPSEIITNVRKHQVATDLTGFEIVNKPTDNTPIILDDTNTIVDLSDDNRTGYRHITVRFFYNRLTYLLKYRNGNRLEEDHTREVMYGAPLNSYDNVSGSYRYWYSDPEYFQEDRRDYYTFEGWYYTPYYYRQVNKDTATMPADDMTVYAKWDPKEINVTFYPTYNDFYAEVHQLDEEDHKVDETFRVRYGDFIPIGKVPADVGDIPEGSTRPILTPPADEAMFAGWYYLRDNIPVRFEPENIPVTALNKESSVDEGHLRLYAEWVTRDVGKFRISYVEKDHPENEVAHHTIGRAFVWKTRTFEAKSGTELNEDHEWTENGRNWWPTVTSHSLVIRSNSQGSEYAPNEFSFEYIQKQGVHYRVEYLNAVNRKPLLDPAELGKDDVYSTRGSVKEDAPYIPGYIADHISQTMVLSASTEDTEEAQRTEELATNVITFYYTKNDTEYLYQVEYYKQNIDDDDYSLAQTDVMEVEIADDPDTPAVEDTTIRLSDLYNGQTPQSYIANGFARVPGATQVIVTDSSGASTVTTAADDAVLTITATERTTVKIYFDRNRYGYTVQYVDYHQERTYLDTPAGERGDMWNGLIDTFDSDTTYRVEHEISVDAPQDLTYETHPYTRINNQTLQLTIGPISEINPDINVIKIYYKKFYERELQYKLVCVNDNELTDYDDETGAPLYGGLSSTDQTIESYDSIADVTFYSFNNAKAPGTNTYLHDHRYTFLGWYTVNEYDPEHPEQNRLTTAETLTKSAMGLNESLPARDSTYYALVKQDTVKANFEFRIVEEALPTPDPDATTEEEIAVDNAAALIVANAVSDPNGDYTGGRFVFTDPSDYVNNTEIMWRRSEGYSLSIQPKDNRVYKYEFTEWWEENTTTHQMIRHHNLHNSEWDVTSIERQLDRKEDKHIIAVYKRRAVTDMPYTISYRFTTRFGEEKSFIKKGVLNAEQLDESGENCAITSDGDYRLTDSFILRQSPFESNYGEELSWSDAEDCMEKTSEKGHDAIPASKEGEEDVPATVDRTIAAVTAQQTVKSVYANYRLSPDAEAYTALRSFYGANCELDEGLKVIEAPATYNGMQFSHWAVRKSESESAPVIAKGYDPIFDLCMMDTYWITPVYEDAPAPAGDPAEDPTEADPTVTLAHLDYSRNRWTDSEGEIASSGETDLLFSDFEIAFEDFGVDIDHSAEHHCGVIFEVCARVPDEVTFDPDKDYKAVTNYENLADAIKDHIDGKPITQYEFKTGKRRSVQFCDIPNSDLTNHDRIVFSKYYQNAYTESDGVRSYSNSPYLLKATAYLVKDGKVTLSNSIYVCYKTIAAQDDALAGMIVIGSDS